MEVDESYTLKICKDGSPIEIVSQTIYGAYHALKVFCMSFFTMIRPSLNWLYLIPIQRLIWFVTHPGPSRIDPHSLYFFHSPYQQWCSIVVCYWILAIITCLNPLLRRSLIACIITNWMYFIGNYLRLLHCHFNLPYMSIYGRVRSLKKNVTPMYEWWFQSEWIRRIFEKSLIIVVNEVFV